MEYSFNLSGKAFSVNAYYYRTRSIKTKEAREWEKSILEQLEEHKQLHDMADMWRKSGGCFRICIHVYYPKYLYYNKSGQISAKTFDVTNVEKPLVDLIMGEFMDINDRNLVKCISSKGWGLTHSIDITLELLSPLDA